MNNKKEERKSHFKKKSKKTKRMTEKEDPPVTVNIGIMRYIEEENMLKPQRGKSLPVRIGRTADGEEKQNKNLNRTKRTQSCTSDM